MENRLSWSYWKCGVKHFAKSKKIGRADRKNRGQRPGAIGFTIRGRTSCGEMFANWHRLTLP